MLVTPLDELLTPFIDIKEVNRILPNFYICESSICFEGSHLEAVHIDLNEVHRALRFY